MGEKIFRIVLGKVYLVGAGPGDPELITVKGMKVLQMADVVIYDRLVDRGVLAFASNARELICVGKERGESWKQEEINELLVRKAREYNVVVRLKNGDPMIFARGGEECEALRDAGIPYEIVPGVSSAIAAPSYAGIPLTHRDYSASVAIVTGHRREGYQGDLGYLRRVFSSVDTVVVLMGVSNIDAIVGEALASGLPPETPVAIIENATTRHQRIVEGSLADIPLRAKDEGVKPPAVMVFGKVVSLRRRLRWMD